MKTTRYTITSKKVIAIALALVLLATVFTGCNRTNEKETTTTTTTEVQTTIEVVTEIVTDENGETVTNDNGEAVTTEVTKVVEVTGQSEETTSNKTTTTTSTTKQTETTTKKNTSTGSLNKVTTTKPVTTTTKPAVTECNNTWTNWKNLRLWVQERTCSKCGWIEEREVDNRDNFMGSKSEYLELLGYVNQARREAGLNELVYVNEFQSGANTRAQELTQKFSHTRPNGDYYHSVFSKYKFTTMYGYLYTSTSENICSGASTAKQAFNAWMNSAGHKAAILSEDGFGFVASRCGTYWMMAVVCGTPSE